MRGKTRDLESNAWIQEGNRYHFESFDPQVVLHDVPGGTQKVRIRGIFQLFDDGFKETRMRYYRGLTRQTRTKKEPDGYGMRAVEKINNTDSIFLQGDGT